MCELPICEKQSIDEHQLVKNIIKKYNKWLKRMGLKPQLRIVQDLLQKIKITHANRRRQRIHRVKSKRQRVDSSSEQMDLSSPGSTSKSCNFKLNDDDKICDSHMKLKESGCMSDKMSIQEESTVGTQSLRKSCNSSNSPLPFAKTNSFSTSSDDVNDQVKEI